MIDCCAEVADNAAEYQRALREVVEAAAACGEAVAICRRALEDNGVFSGDSLWVLVFVLVFLLGVAIGCCLSCDCPCRSKPAPKIRPVPAVWTATTFEAGVTTPRSESGSEIGGVRRRGRIVE